MFDVGFSELVLLFIIGLLVLGPQRLPKVAAEVGKWVGRARRTATQLRRQLEREIELADIQNPPSGGTPPASAKTPADAQPAAPEQNPFVASVDAPVESDGMSTNVPDGSSTGGDDAPTHTPAVPPEVESKPLPP
jgi:sec-independent protein translocase protein TatB